ncbi:MAG: type II toxin-antitoxin system RelE/ParE family toxin [Acidobacteriaceae bacterium]|nr:type II toxin-antitoxin system RelE/ParE family toxin [Acidobacteriaceae bacterium]
MRYQVEFAARADRDLEVLYIEKNAVESRAAARWFNGLEQAILALEKYPYRCPVAMESSRIKRELRHLLYGRKPHVYRVLYEVDEGRKIVWVLTVRHGARKRLRASDLNGR